MRSDNVHLKAGRNQLRVTDDIQSRLQRLKINDKYYGTKKIGN